MLPAANFCQPLAFALGQDARGCVQGHAATWRAVSGGAEAVRHAEEAVQVVHLQEPSHIYRLPVHDRHSLYALEIYACR